MRNRKSDFNFKSSVHSHHVVFRCKMPRDNTLVVFTEGKQISPDSLMSRESMIRDNSTLFSKWIESIEIRLIIRKKIYFTLSLSVSMERDEYDQHISEVIEIASDTVHPTEHFLNW